MLIIAALALIIGGLILLLLIRPSQQKKVREIKYMQTTTVRELEDSFATMTEEGVADHFRSYIELKGTVVCDNPVRTPFSNQEVAFCASKLMSVTQKVEHYTDSEGNHRSRTRKDENVLTSESTSDVLYFKDSSSDTCVVLDIKNDCSFDIPETFDRFELAQNARKYPYFRRFAPCGDHFLGYRMLEKTVPLNQPLYVLGEAYKEGDTLHVGKPSSRDKEFIVSTQSEEQMVGSYEKNANIALWSGIAILVFGILMLVTSIIR